MAAEVDALVNAINNGYVICEVLEWTLERTIDIEAYVESCTLFNVVEKDSSTAERRLQINMFALRKTYGRREMKKLE